MALGKKSFRRVLIANRGEIAIRIARAAREMGISPWAVYSAADEHSPLLAHCDGASLLGPGPAQASYLNQDKLLAIAQTVGADAIHPGYGFLAENAQFALAVQQAGLTLIGPPVRAMTLMGNKVSARKAMQQAGVPVVPGSESAVADLTTAGQLAQQMGYPIMLKAAAGGGGKGMRLVHQANGLEQAFRLATSEALSAFGDGTLYVEKAIIEPKHVEIQIFSDSHGRHIHLGERECSLQRRHQKIVEESPSPAVSPALRAAMGQVACQAAAAVDYQGAGTVEFLLGQDGQFYFLEMNTRLQVEHPVTEWCWGVDLVAGQFEVAQGGALPWQHPISRGHAIEARLYAEDPSKGFLPSPGKLLRFQGPSGPFVRWDSGFVSGNHISRYYDPMLAKLSVWGENRYQAIGRMTRALHECKVVGLANNVSLLQHIMAHPEFVAGTYHTGSLEQWLAQPSWQHPPEEQAIVAGLASLSVALYQQQHQTSSEPSHHPLKPGAWQGLTARRPWGAL